MLSLDKQNELREQYRQQTQGWEPATETYAALVRNAFYPTSRILDLGCGRGGLIEQLVETHGQKILQQTIGLDPDWRSVSEHRLNLPAAVGTSHTLPFADNSFDVVFCSWLLEHLPTPEQDFGEISRILKPNGSFIFITPNIKHPLVKLMRLIGRFAAVQDWLVERLYGRTSADTFPTFYLANSQSQLNSLAKDRFAIGSLSFIPDPTYLAFRPLMFKVMVWVEHLLPQQRKLHLVGRLVNKVDSDNRQG